MEEQPKQQQYTLTPNKTQDVKLERKVRVGEDTPSQFVKTDKLSSTTEDVCLLSGMNVFDGLATFSPDSVVLPTREKKLEIKEKKEQKSFSPSSDPIKPPLDIKDSRSKSLVTKEIKFPGLQAALKSYYGAQGALKLPLSGRRFPIKDVSLTISDKSEQDQREKARQSDEEKKSTSKPESKDSKKNKPDVFWSSRFRLEEEWYRINKPIAVKDIFTVEKSSSPIRRVLVEGRAGVGKTTFSQYVAYQWVQQQLFAGQFDYVFWLPLRQCLSIDTDNRGSMEAHTAAFIYEQQIPVGERFDIRPQDIETVLSSGENHRTLFVLDGFDEVAGQLADSDQPFCVILDELLKFPNLIITTRDYQIPPSQYTFDRRLVNVGFTDAQISAYIQSYSAFQSTLAETDQEKKHEIKSSSETSSLASQPGFTNQNAERLEAALKQNPRFWGLAHIPLNLALILESWPSAQMNCSPAMGSTEDSLPSDSKINSPLSASAELNMTSLYQNVLVCFLKRDMQKYEFVSTTLTWDVLSESYALELLSLGAIAWQGMQTQQQILSTSPLTKALALVISDYPEINKQILKLAITQALNLGFIRHNSGEEATPLLDRHYYFIHLTFQEYFAAYYMLQILQGRRGEHSWRAMQVWLTQHKYEPRYAVLLSFLAGLTTQPGYDQALDAFWYALLSPPQDVVGVQYMQLIVRCLIEARFDKRIPGRAQILEEFRQWVDAMAVMNLYPEKMQVKTEWLTALLEQEPKLLQLCGWVRPRLISSINEEQWWENPISVLSKLGKSLAAHPESFSFVLKAIEDKDWRICSQAVTILGGLGEQLVEHPKAFAAVLKASEHEDRLGSVLDVLGGLGKRLLEFPEALAIVVKTLGSGSHSRGCAIKALSNIGEDLLAYPTAIAALIKALDANDYSVSITAAQVLCSLGDYLPTHPIVLALIIKQGLLPCIEEKLSKLSLHLLAYPQTFTLLLKAIDTDDRETRSALEKILDQSSEYVADYPEALDIVFKAVDDESEDIRRAAISMLGMPRRHSCNYTKSLTVLLKAAEDKKAKIREIAIVSLNQYLVAHPEAFSIVMKAVDDEAWYVRGVAIWVLGKHQVSFPETFTVILKATCDIKYNVRVTAINSLSTCLTTHPEAFAAVLKALNDEMWVVRYSAIQALEQLGKSLIAYPEAIAAVVRTITNVEIFRSTSIKILCNLEENLIDHPEAFAEVLKIASDVTTIDREPAVRGLGRLGSFLFTQVEAFEVVLNALKGGTRASSAAIEVLVKLSQLLPAHPKALAAILQITDDENPYIRQAVAELLKALDTIALVEHYLAAVTQQQSTQDVYLNTLRKHIRLTCPTLTFDGRALTVVSNSQSKRLPLSSPELARPLIETIEKKWQLYIFPTLSFQACVSKTPRYSTVEAPVFQATTKLPLKAGIKRRAQQIAESKTHAELEPLSSTGRITLDFKLRYHDLLLHEPPLGKGAFGAVYRGKYRLETVAIKRFLLDDFSTERQKEIRHEASIMVAIQSDYLVRLRGICLDAPHYCVVMEYFPRGDVYGVLHPQQDSLGNCDPLSKPEKPLSLSQCYRLAADMAIGLYHLHQRGVLHRDLKSLNVLLQEREGELRGKLSDFGLSTLKRSLLRGEGIVGSLPWLAPEIVKGTGEYSKASDVYSLGMVLYELATGNLPYYSLPDKTEKPSFTQIKNWISTGVRPWQNIPKDCPIELVQLIRDCCAEDPKDRLAAAIIAQRLEALYAATKKMSESISNLPHTTKTPPPASLPKETKEDRKQRPSLPITSTTYRPRLFSPAPISFSQAHWLPSLQQKLQELCGNQGYTFQINRPLADRLVLQFTALNTVLANEKEIKDELIALARLLQELISHMGIPIKPSQYKPDWRQWTLTIQAEPALLDQIANLLHSASLAYLSLESKTGAGFFQSSQIGSSDSTSDTVTATCGIQ